MRTKTAEQIKQENIHLMGKPLGAIYTELWQELNETFHLHNEFLELFGENQARIDLLNYTAGHFFALVQRCMLDSLLLKISRITDKIKTRGSNLMQNLTICRLPQEVEDLQLKNQLQLLVTSSVSACEFALDWRNRYIAHHSLDIALGEETVLLPAVSNEKINQALNSIELVMNCVAEHFHQSPTSFKDTFSIHAARDFIHVLDFGFNKLQTSRQNIENGTYTEEDLANLFHKSP